MPRRAAARSLVRRLLLRFSVCGLVTLAGAGLSRRALASEWAPTAPDALPEVPVWRLTTPIVLAPSPSASLGPGWPTALADEWVPGQPLPPGMQPPAEYPYTPGDPILEGYHVEDRPRRGMVVAGYLVAGIPYGLGVLVAGAKRFENEMHWMLLPFAGPWLTFAFRERACNEIGETAFDSWHCVSDRMSEWLLIGDGVLQAVGGTFLLIGYTSTRPFAVRNDSATLHLTPAPIGDGYGVFAWGTL
jgi:hypothetical protein